MRSFDEPGVESPESKKEFIKMDKDQIFGFGVLAIFVIAVFLFQRSKRAEKFRKSNFFRIYSPLLAGLFFVIVPGIIQGDKFLLIVGLCFIGTPLFLYYSDRRKKS